MDAHIVEKQGYMYSPDNTLACLKDDRGLSILNVATGKIKKLSFTKDISINDVAFTHDSALLFTIDSKKLMSWDTQKGVAKIAFRGHKDFITNFALTPKYVCTASRDKTCRIWDIKTGELRHVLYHDTWVPSVAANKEYVVTSQGDSPRMKVWDIRTGKPTRLLSGHTYRCDFRVDGSRIISWSLDRKLIVWDIRTGEKEIQIEHFQGINYADLSANYLVYSSGGIVYAMKLRTMDLYRVVEYGRCDFVYPTFIADDTLIINSDVWRLDSAPKTVFALSLAIGGDGDFGIARKLLTHFQSCPSLTLKHLEGVYYVQIPTG